MTAVLVVLAIVIFIAGGAVGAILLVSWGIQREERNFSLTRKAPGLASQGARQVTGLWVRRRTDLDPTLERQPEMLV
jgi:L-asparagine transporter-like permease